MILPLIFFVSLLLGYFSLLNISGGKFSLAVLLALAFPVGIGISSLLFIVLNLLHLPVLFILLIEISLIAFLIIQNKNANPLQRILKINFNLLFRDYILLFILCVFFYSWLMDAGLFIFESAKEPHGLWDAWSYWNLKAKFIARSPYEWPSLFHQLRSEDFHPDYPLLQTGYIARCWLILKNESVMVPVLFAFIITFSTIGLLTTAVRTFTTLKQGLIAGLILLCTPFYMTMGFSQYADNTIGFFFLATVVLLTMAYKTEDNKKLFIAAGFTAGLSAWSKNEGLLFIFCLMISMAGIYLLTKRKGIVRDIKLISLGMLPVLSVVIYYKVMIAPANDLIQSQGATTISKLSDPGRYALVGTWYANQFKGFGQWIFNPWWLFLGGIILKGVDLKKQAPIIRIGLITILLMLTGYFFIYITSYIDLTFHLSTSLHRLFFQLFPTFIFIYFLALKNENQTT
jgi:hypothetical protein